MHVQRARGPQTTGAMTRSRPAAKTPARKRGMESSDALFGTQPGLGGPHPARRAVRGRRDRGARVHAANVQERPAQRPRDLALHRRLRRPGVPRLRGRADHLCPGAGAGRFDRQLDAGQGRGARRPRGDRHAQLSGMDADLLGLRLHRRGGGGHERLVDRLGDGLRPGRRPAEGAVRGRRAHRPDRRTAGHAGRGAAGRRANRSPQRPRPGPR
jgi:hypothetical protein